MSTKNISVRGIGFTVQSRAVAQHDRFWDKVNRGDWETDTFRVIDELVDAKTLAIDCGSWIGPTSLYMAQRAGLCVGFEPDPVAYEVLDQNVQLNAGAPWSGKLKICNAAIHSSGAPIRIAAAGGGGNSMTSALNVNFDAVWTVETQRLQDVLAQHRGKFRKVFVKIDVEGGEYDILPSIADVLADESVFFLISFHHRRLKLALMERSASPEAAADALARTLGSVVEALPWQRGIRTIDGQAFPRKAVEQAAAKGRSFADDVLIG